MDKLQIIMDSVDSKACERNLKKLMELNPDIKADCMGKEFDFYNFRNTDGELVCVLPFSSTIPVSKQSKFWFALLLMIDTNKLY